MENTVSKDLELYIHIPFCVRKCLYCDFLSGPADTDVQEAYMEALLSEIKGRAQEGEGYRVVSVFIGGGTPSVVKPEWIRHLMDHIRMYFQVASDAEITMELNPGTVTREGLESYLAAGINRLSIGLQSADDALLEQIGRIHTWKEFERTYAWAREAGFANLNVDLMSGLPGQDMDNYTDTLKKVCELPKPPEHISAYGLIVEEGTPLARLVEEGKISPADEETERQMYEVTEKLLAHYGYERYEISNYAKEGYACRHNIGYWTRVSYLGFGLGAASLMEERRFRNGDDLKAYIARPLQCRCIPEEIDEKGQMEEFCFLGLRLVRGISESDFYQRFGVTLKEVYGPVIERNQKDGLLEVFEEKNGEIRLALTHRGLDLANYCMAQFLLD